MIERGEGIEINLNEWTISLEITFERERGNPQST